jgi:hypothetical protein
MVCSPLDLGKAVLFPGKAVLFPEDMRVGGACTVDPGPVAVRIYVLTPTLLGKNVLNWSLLDDLSSRIGLIAAFRFANLCILIWHDEC